MINCSRRGNAIHIDGIPCGLLEGQHQGIRLWKDLIFHLSRNLEPFAAIFDNSVVYGDFASSANEAQRGSRGFKTVLDVLTRLHASKGAERGIVLAYVETSIFK